MKKIVAVLATLCILGGPIASLAQPRTQYTSAEIYELAQKIEAATKDKIWDGFDFRNYTRAESGTATGGYLYFSTEPDNKSTENFFWKLTDEYFLDHGLEDDLVIVFHEAFHAFQRDPKREGSRWGAENAMLVFEYQESSARSNALFAMEAQILHLALQSKKRKDLKTRVRQFLAIRNLRQTEIEPRFVEFEKRAELNEGLAEYAGTKAVRLGLEASRQKRISVPFTAMSDAAFMAGKFEPLDSINKVGVNIRRKFYYTGSAIGLLLDRLMPNWKQKVQMQGASLQDLLETGLGPTKAPLDMDDLLSKHGFEKILNDEEQAVARRKDANQTLLDSTLNQKGRKYVIDYSALTKPLGVRSFDPMNVTMITPKVRIHTRSVTFAGQDTVLASFSQPVVEDLDRERYTTIVSGTQSEHLLIDGNEVDLRRPFQGRFFKELTLTSDKFNLKAKTGNIEISSDEIIIHLTDN